MRQAYQCCRKGGGASDLLPPRRCFKRYCKLRINTANKSQNYTPEVKLKANSRCIEPVCIEPVLRLRLGGAAIFFTLFNFSTSRESHVPRSHCHAIANNSDIGGQANSDAHE